MTTKADILTQSLIDYINDVKPFHTKFRNVTSQLFFSDKLNANVREHFTLDVHLQNMWGRDDLGGYTLFNLAEGSESDRTYILPTAIFPHFSFNEATSPDRGTQRSYQSWNDMIPVSAAILNVTQLITNEALVSGQWVVTSTITAIIDNENETAFGFDPSSIQVSVNGQLWAGPFGKIGNIIQINGFTQTYASQAAYLATKDQFEDLVPSVSIEVLYLQTGRYAVPFHQGSRVYVNDVGQEFGADYIVDSSRSFIQFTNGNWPQTGDLIDINLMRSDRLFISKNAPFVPVQDYFLLTITGPGESDVTFINSQPGTSKATLQNVSVSGSVGEVWKITAIAPWSFSVQRISPTSSVVENAGFKVPFSNNSISFTIDRIWDTFYTTDAGSFYSYFIIQQENSYAAFDALPLDSEISYDSSEFMPNLSVTDTQNVTFSPLGVVQKNSAGDYVFVLSEVPAPYTYIEFKVEEANQFNPFVNASITEQINFFDLLNFSEECASNSEPWWGQYALAQYSSSSAPLVSGQQYIIASLGTTDFTLIGASSNTIGLTFTSTSNAAIVGTGTASEVEPANAVSSPLYPRQPRVTWYDTNKFYDMIVYDEGTYDDATFIPHTDLNLLTGALDSPNHPRLDSEGFYPYVRDDMYLTVVLQDTLETRIRHNVVLLGNANLYQESQLINDLVIYRTGDAITAAVVYLDGIPIDPSDPFAPHTITFNQPSSNGHIKPVLADATIHTEVIISFNTGVSPKSFAVKLS